MKVNKNRFEPEMSQVAEHMPYMYKVLHVQGPSTATLHYWHCCVWLDINKTIV